MTGMKSVYKPPGGGTPLPFTLCGRAVLPQRTRELARIVREYDRFSFPNQKIAAPCHSRHRQVVGAVQVSRPSWLLRRQTLLPDLLENSEAPELRMNHQGNRGGLPTQLRSRADPSPLLPERRRPPLRTSSVIAARQPPPDGERIPPDS